MSRYIKEIQLEQPIDVVSAIMDDFTYHNNFIRSDWNGEMVYYEKDRYGKERYLIWSYTGGLFRVEAWIKGMFGGEKNIAGGGNLSCNEYRNAISRLLQDLATVQSDYLQNGHIGSDPLHHDMDDFEEDHERWEQDTSWNQQTIPQREVDQNNVKAISFAALAFLFVNIAPSISIIFALIAWKMKASGRHSNLVTIACSFATITTIAALLAEVLKTMPLE